jgi:hypothetical protein
MKATTTTKWSEKRNLATNTGKIFAILLMGKNTHLGTHPGKSPRIDFPESPP